MKTGSIIEMNQNCDVNCVNDLFSVWFDPHEHEWHDLILIRK